MSRSARRLTSPTAMILAATVLAGSLLAACTGPADPTRPLQILAPTPSQPYGPYPTLPVTGGLPPVGNTDRQFPELSVSRDGGYLIDLVDPAARAWWIVISGTGIREGDRVEILAEVGDIWPGAAVNLYVGGELVDSTDLNGLLGNPTAIVGGCHPTLDLCFSSAGVNLRPEEGRLSVTLEGGDAGRFEIQGATAAWDGEPYILAPWTGTGTVPAG